MRDVVLHMNGGLGNQLFELAAAIAAAGDVEHVSVIPTSETGRVEELLGTRLGRATGWSAAASMALRRSSRSLHRRIPRPGRTARRYVHPDTAFTARPRDRGAGRPWMLDGYFQHPSWYEAGVEAVTTMIRTAAPPSDERSGTSIHLRRGDYVRHGVALPTSYYDEALHLLGSDVGTVTVIGDDPLTCDLLADDLTRRGHRAASRTAGSDVDDFRAVAASRHVVMSNSTFCWWAVVANTSSWAPHERTIVAPERWMPDPASSCLVRDGWRTLPAPDAWGHGASA